MKHRNPIFVAGFPYILFFFGYLGLQVINFSRVGKATGSDELNLSSLQIVSIIFAAILLLLAAIYTWYWLISTARVMRKAINADIPHGILLAIPLVNYYWYWKYSKGVEAYTGGKIQSVLAFVVIAIVGSIGMGILQDTYNKTPQHDSGTPTAPPVA